MSRSHRANPSGRGRPAPSRSHRRPPTPAGRSGPRPASRPGARPASFWSRRRVVASIGVAVVVVGALLAILIGVTGGPSRSPSGTTALVTGPPGPEGIPLEEGTVLAPSVTPAMGGTVDGIECNANEQVVYHVHTHLSVYVDGQLRPLPAGIGIVDPVPQETAQGPFDEASHCYYWLHVHAPDGVIHIESPSVRTYTLGQFFDIWGQPLGTGRVGPVTGPMTVFVDGRRYRGDPRAITLGSHETIQIDVGSPSVSPRGVDWSGTGL